VSSSDGWHCHLYSNHLDQVDEQLARCADTANLVRRPPMFSTTPEDFQIVNYQHHPTIKATRRGMSKPKKKKVAAFDQSQPTRGGPPIVSAFVEVRNSPVHGRGVFARTVFRRARGSSNISASASRKAADDRYVDVNDNNHLLFIVDKHGHRCQRG
jgi:hypothetical protein